MSIRSLPLSPLLEEMGLPMGFENAEAGLVRWIRSEAPGRQTMAVIDISAEDDGQYLLTFNRSELQDGARVGDMILFDAWYKPGERTIEVVEDGADDPDDLYAGFCSGISRDDLEAVDL